MDAEPETDLPALLSPSIQDAMRLLSFLAIGAIGATAWWASGSPEPPRLDRNGVMFRVDLNEAGERELTLLPGIGALTAQRIIEDRHAKGPFRSLLDLARVPGIGPKTIDQIEPYCRVAPAAEAPSPGDDLGIRAN
jgi:competence protein ComEA